MGQNNDDSQLLSDDKFEDDDDSNESLAHPQQRNAANARERARMRVLSRAFCRLKTTLPWVPADTKLSKLDTLRLATSYIAHLRAVLKLSENEPTKHTTEQATNMNWPFNFSSTWEKQWTAKNDDKATKLQLIGYGNRCDQKYSRDGERPIISCEDSRERGRTIDINRNINTSSSKLRRKKTANYKQQSQFSRQSLSEAEIMSCDFQNNYYKPYSLY